MIYKIYNNFDFHTISPHDILKKKDHYTTDIL